MTEAPLRLALVAVPEDESAETVCEKVANYLPSNYSVAVRSPDNAVFISGHDQAGWTLDGYVIPRLASGLLFAKEVSA